MNLETEVKEYMENKHKSIITATAYQEQAKTTAIFPADHALEYLTLGLVGEAGEVANKIKKIFRDKKIFKTDVEVADEIGDVLWYCAMLADYLDVDLGKIMENNLEKLSSRKKRGTLGGSGDRR